MLALPFISIASQVYVNEIARMVLTTLWHDEIQGGKAKTVYQGARLRLEPSEDQFPSPFQYMLTDM